MKAFKLLISSFLIELIFVEPNESFFQKLKSSLETQRAKEKFPDNPSHNILQFYNVLV